MKRYGTVLVFKQEVSEEEIREALDKIVDVLDDGYWLDPGQNLGGTVPFRLEEFDGEEGGPVWHIP